MRLVAISGSLRAASLNTSVLQAARRLAPAGVDIEIFDGIGDLPFFNSDLEGGELPEQVARFRHVIANADGVISSPEYARGISGVMKNALDWLVGSEEFPGKPVPLINTSPRATPRSPHSRSRSRRCRPN
jgi:chromate reductase